MVGDFSGVGKDNLAVLDSTDTQNVFEYGELYLGSTAHDIAVKDNYAYIASNDDDKELLIADISNDMSPILVNSYDISGELEAFCVDIVGDYLYVGLKNDSDHNNFYIFNIQNQTNPVV